MNAPLHFATGAPGLSAQQLDAELREALGMVGMASLRDDLRVELGQWWAFDWLEKKITIPLEELERCTRAEICWIILHEAAHSVLTRLHEFLPSSLRNQPGIPLLINCIEDVRIERWLLERFPGSKLWHDAAHADLLENPSVQAGQHPVHCFLNSIICFGKTGRFPDNLTPEVRALLELCRAPLEAAFDCVPPAAAGLTHTAEEVYAAHPVSRSYAVLDETLEPGAFEKWARIMQASSWIHTASGVLPHYLKLVDRHGAPEMPHQRQVLVLNHGGLAARALRKGLGGPVRVHHASLTSNLRDALAGTTNGPYLRAVNEYANEIREVTETLQRLLPNNRSLKHESGYASGERLDLRRAAQFEADKRLHHKLWMQRRRRSLPEPAFCFVVDRSGSMHNCGKAQAAFDSLVIIREACSRAGIPFSVIVFNGHSTLLHGWNRLSDEQCEAALSTILKPEGDTRLGLALNAALQQLETRPERDRIIFLLTDGDVRASDMATVREINAELERTGVRVLPIGIDAEILTLREIYPGAESIQHADELPLTLANALVRSLFAA